MVPNISTSSEYYKDKLKPLGLTPNTAFPNNNTIPASLFDSDGLLYLNSGILPPVTNPATDQNTTSASNPITVLDTVLRIDHKFSDKWAILGHYMDDQVTQGYAAPELGWLWASYNTLTSTLSNPSQSAAIKISGTINPNLLLEASINYDGNVLNIIPSANTFLPSGWTQTPIAAPFTITRKVWPGMGYFGPYGTAEDTGSAPWHNAARDYEPKVDISYTMGKHAMKYGFSYNRYDKNQQVFGDSQGNFGPSGTTNDSLMDLLLGIAGGYSQLNDAPIRHWVNQTPSAYIEDNWHMTPRFSLQLGFRYDALPHAWERDNAQWPTSTQLLHPVGTADLDGAGHHRSVQPVRFHSEQPRAPPLPFYLNGIRVAGSYGTPRGEVENKYTTWQPRIGFSEDLFGNGKTVLRGGFGTFFERTQGNDVYNAAPNAPFVYNAGTGNPTWQSGQKLAEDRRAAGFPVFATASGSLPESLPTTGCGHVQPGRAA